MADQITAGEALRSTITHLDADNAPITGETFVIDYAKRGDDSDFTVTITEVGNGLYRVDGATAATDPPGTWILVVRALGNDARYQKEWDVIVGRPTIVLAQAPTTTGVTRQTLRRMVARDLGDLHLVTATAFGTESSIVSDQDLTQEYNHYAGMQVVCVGGTPANLGQIGTVKVSDDVTRSVAFIPPFPAATAPGDEFEFYNFRGIGWRLEQYNAAINGAIVRAGEAHATIPHVATTAAFNRVLPYVEIPAEFTHLSAVEIIDPSGARRRVPPTGMGIDTATAEVTLLGDWAGRGHGRALRLIGHRRPGTLETDDAATTLSTEWLVAEAKAMLLERDTAQGTTQGGRDRLFYLERQGAEGRRPSTLTSYPPNTVRLMR